MPIIFLAHAFDGDWVRAASPCQPPREPVLFYQLSEGFLGPVLYGSQVALFRKDFAAFLTDHAFGDFECFTSIIRRPRSEIGIHDYLVVKLSTRTRTADLAAPVGYPLLSAWQEVPDCILVSAELRQLIEASFPSEFEFEKPVVYGA